ncbi:MAG TPA: IPT/TIG domain-containing protein, partial [Chloroflexota bacterium]|nr:IPT/TIG domain-containing protein [Chloroflexota bacterium]
TNDTFGATSVLTTDSNASSFLEMLGGTDTYSTGAAITGTGVYLDGSTLSGSGKDISDSGKKKKSSILAVYGALNWTGGTFGTNGTTVIEPSGTLSITSGATVSMSNSGSHLLNDGTVNWTAGTFCVNGGALLENAAQFNVGNNLTMEGCSGNGTFQNDAAGLVLRNSGSNNTDIDTPFTNSGVVRAVNGTGLRLFGLTNASGGKLTGGTYDAESGSVIVLPGTLTTDAATMIIGAGGSDFVNQANNQGIENSLTAISAGSSLTLNRSFTSSVSGLANSGTLSLCASCALTLSSGTFSQVAGGTLSLAVAGTGSGAFSSIGASSSSIAGALSVLNAGGFIPSSGQMVQPIAAGASGGFSNSSSNDWNDAVSAGALTLTAKTPAPAPTISSVSPGALGQGATAQKVTINGNNFTTGATVTFSTPGVTATAVSVTSTKITATVNVALGATPGAGTVTVTNPDGDTVSSAFSVDAGPQVSSISPTTIKPGSTESIVLTGSNFAAGDKVTLSGKGLTVKSTTVNGPTQITISVTATSKAKLGNSNVTVTATDGGTGTCYACLTIL